MKRWTKLFLALLLPLASTWVQAQTNDLPAIDTILKRVREKAQQEQFNDRRFVSRYSFVRTRTTRELDYKGHLKKEQTKQSRSTPRIVPATYNVPAGLRASAPSAQGNQVSQTSAKSQDKPYDKSDFSLDEDLMGRFDYKV